MAASKLRFIVEQTPVLEMQIMQPDSGFFVCLKRKSNAQATIRKAENNKNIQLVLDPHLNDLKKYLEYDESLNERNSRNLLPSLDELKSDVLSERNAIFFSGKYKDVSHYIESNPLRCSSSL